MSNVYQGQTCDERGQSVRLKVNPNVRIPGTGSEFLRDSTNKMELFKYLASWGRSRHIGQVDIGLNDTCRIITGCLKATPIPCLYALAGIAPPHIRRKVASNADRCLQEDDPRHPLHGQRPAKHRLPSRNSSIDSTDWQFHEVRDKVKLK